MINSSVFSCHFIGLVFLSAVHLCLTITRSKAINDVSVRAGTHWWLFLYFFVGVKIVSCGNTFRLLSELHVRCYLLMDVCRLSFMCSRAYTELTFGCEWHTFCVRQYQAKTLLSNHLLDVWKYSFRPRSLQKYPNTGLLAVMVSRKIEVWADQFKHCFVFSSYCFIFYFTFSMLFICCIIVIFVLLLFSLLPFQLTRGLIPNPNMTTAKKSIVYHFIQGVFETPGQTSGLISSHQKKLISIYVGIHVVFDIKSDNMLALHL